jgi:tight adherence protein C
MRIIATIASLAMLAACLAAGMAARGLWRRGRVRARLLASVDDPFQLPADDARGWLSRWLYLAGYRQSWAPAAYLAATAVGMALGSGFAAVMFGLGAVSQFVAILRLVPGNVGEVFLPIAYGSPWMSAGVLTLVPTLVVRQARRRRVSEVEQDLPLALDLLATLAQSGLGYDSALEQLLRTIPAERALSQEFRAFQVDMLAGRGRVAALRRLSRRVEVPWFGIFVSAITQAEQLGSGLAEILRIQAEDLRQRRRERAMAFAMTIPIKLLFPLVVCFLPAIFVFAIGPAFYQIAQTIDTLLAPYRF